MYTYVYVYITTDLPLSSTKPHTYRQKHTHTYRNDINAKKARTIHKLVCFATSNLAKAFSIPYINATIEANCSPVAKTHFPKADHSTGGAFGLRCGCMASRYESAIFRGMREEEKTEEEGKSRFCVVVCVRVAREEEAG
jgi:hypothetical protein